LKIRHYIPALLSLFISLAVFSQNIDFIENKGQWDERVRFMGAVSNGAFFVHANGFTVLQNNAADMERLHEAAHSRLNRMNGDPLTVRSHAYRVEFLNANKEARIVADKPVPSHNNYFIGDDPSKWASDCRIYGGITIHDIYPNIDVRYYSDRGTLKYDFIVRPGGDVTDIALKYVGADKLNIKKEELVISTSVGELRELAPYSYQYADKGKTKVDARFSLRDNIVRFRIPDYDATVPLVIDPTLVFCSFSGSTADNWGFTATYGPDGSMYGAGIVFAVGFPVSTGAFQTNYGNGSSGCILNGFDIGIIKLSSNGSSRIYATYLGGSGNEMPQSLIVTPAGELIVAGRTNSPITGGGAYPVQGPLGAQVNAGNGSWDIILTKFNAAGSAIINSLRIGGSADDGANIDPCGAPPGGSAALSLQQNYGDEARSEVNLDAAGNIYLSSCTKSTNFPLTNAFQTSNGGGQDGVIMKLDANLSTINFASYFGGSGNDAAYVVSVAPNGNIYIAGGTESSSLPGSTAGTIGQTYGGNIDGFVSIISPNGSSVIRTTYLGTNAIDQVYGLKFDQLGFPYVMGQSLGNWIVTPSGVWSQNNGRQFIAKLQPDLSAYVYSTKFGKGAAAPDISPVAFLVDRCENVYVSGWGARFDGDPHANAGVGGLPVTPDAIKPTPDFNPSRGIAEDFYFFVLKKNATSQLFGSFYGKNGGPFGDHVDGGTSRFDEDGVIYQAICASCGAGGGIPFTTAGAWTVNKPASANCNLAMVKIALNLAGINSGVQSFIDGVPRDTAGCVPLTVDFKDTVLAAVSYEWNFGDGSPQITTTVAQASHTYLAIGTYQVMLVAIDSTTCNIRDTSYMFIKVGANRADIDFNPIKLNPCDSFKYQFDNLSQAPAGFPFKPTSFRWDFGDGSSVVTTGPGPVFHSYAAPGTYTVKLTLNDTAYCNSPETITKQLRVASLVKAKFKTPSTGCAPYTAFFENISDAGSSFTWDFGDGSPQETTTDATHVYTTPGTYTITLIAVDPGTCNVNDTTRFTITVGAYPIADFSVVPQPPTVNTPLSFTNLSSADAIRFKWLFGDGDSLLTTTRTVVMHEYNATGSFNACFIATNSAGCSDTLCRPVQTLIDPAVDVPNAFTPGKPGANSVVYVRGFGIAKMQFAVYARWGEKVFESNSKNSGWNGYYKGALLPMDVYAYTLNVEFTDGTKTTKTGDITLIR